MNEAFDLVSIRRTLNKMLSSGLLPNIDVLDTPSPGFQVNLNLDRHTFPGGYQGVQHRNLLRDHHPEAVQAGPDPRDLAADPKPGVFPGQSPLRTHEQAGPVVRDQDHQSRQEPSGSRCDMESPF